MSISETGQARGVEVDDGGVVGGEVSSSASALATSRPRRGAVAHVASLVVFAVLLLPVYGLWLGSSFLNSQARSFDVYQNVAVLIMAVGLVVCLAAGQFDLSVGSMATLCVFLTIGLRVEQGLPFWLVLLIVLAVGLVGGLINGLFVVKLRVNAFIATLATGGVFEGFSNVYGGGEQMTQGTDKVRLPDYFTGLHSFGSFQSKVPSGVVWAIIGVLLLMAWRVVSEQWPAERRSRKFWAAFVAGAAMSAVALVWARNFTKQVPWVVVFLFGLATAMWVLLRYTPFGRSVYAIGGNPVAARLSGVPVARYTVVSFVITSTIAAISGIVLAANQGTAVPGIATGFLLPAYAAVFLSTVILSDGRFHVWGTVIGGIAVVYVAQGLIIGGVEFTWNQVINGVVLVVAVSFATIVRGKDSMRAH